MSVFEPDITRAIIKSALSDKEHARFDKEWTESVNDHIETWEASNPHAEEAASHAQFTWIAHVVAYIEFLYSRTKPPPRSASTKLLPLTLNVPIYGPRFVPPQYLHTVRRSPSTKVPKIRIETTYLKPINIIHPFYHAPRLSVCSRCGSNNMSWDSWTSTGPRTVYGVRRPELALGYQVRCRDCKEERKRLPLTERATIQYSYTTTSDTFWEKWEYWQIPRGLPVFFHKCAVTHDLLDLIIELRLSSTSGGLAENIKQLHLLEYHQAVVDFLDNYKQHSISDYTNVPLDSFSAYNDPNGWNGKTISGDSITTILLENSSRTHREESSDYLKTLTAVSVSVDATFESTKKAVVTNRSLIRTNPSGGGLFSGINELDEILFWKLCQTMSNAEIIEALDGLKNCHLVLEQPMPKIATADNCCHVRNTIVSVFPEIHVVLDVYHFLMRYAVAIVNGKKNVFYWVVIEDVREAILMKKADKDSKAFYRPQGDQELRLEAVFVSWTQHGGVWTAAAARVHETQMNHVKKGCLAQHHQDIATDGSRIEGTHKGWNSIMRSHACGLEVFVALGHDFVLRRNVHVAIARKQPPEFIASAEGSHHLRLVDHIAKRWNSLLDARKRTGHGSSGLIRLPRLPKVMSGEVFGVVKSVDAESYGGLLRMKEEALEADLMEMIDESEVDIQSVSSQLQIEPELFLREDASSAGAVVKRAVTVGSGTAPTPSSMSLIIDPSLLDARAESSTPAAVLKSRPSGTVTAASISIPVEDAALGNSSHSEKHAGSPSRDDIDLSSVVDLTLDNESDDEADCVKSSRKPPTRKSQAAALRKRKAQDAGAPDDPRQPVKKARFVEDDGAYRQSNFVVQGTQLGRTSGPRGGAIDDFFRHCKPPSHTGQAGNHNSDSESPAPPAAQDTTAPSSAAPAASSAAHATVNTHSPAATNTVPATVPARNMHASAARNSAATSPRAITELSPAAAQMTSLMSPLPVPSSPAGLSRTERMWSSFTMMDAQSMTIAPGGESWVFMDVRAEQQWSMATMTPRKWVAATELYNRKLHEWCNEHNLPVPVLKHPRALVDHLDEAEDKIISRILKDDYKTRPPNGKEGTEIYWRRHCHAVPGMVKDGRTPKRRPPKCAHCRILKYTTGVRGASNHQRDCCSDGVRSRIEGDKLLPWPQPPGVFEDGNTFSVPAFANAVCRLYDHLVLHQFHTIALPLEYQAFGVFLMERLIITEDGAVLFPLYEHTTTLRPEPHQLPPGLLIEYSGKHCIKVPQLSHDNDNGSGSGSGHVGPVAGPVTRFFSLQVAAAANKAAVADGADTAETATAAAANGASTSSQAL